MTSTNPAATRKKFNPRSFLAVLVLLFIGLTFTDIPLDAEIKMIHFYQGNISPVSSHFVTCRFQPT
jgi:hypothetical protein